MMRCNTYDWGNVFKLTYRCLVSLLITDYPSIPNDIITRDYSICHTTDESTYILENLEYSNIGRIATMIALGRSKSWAKIGFDI